MPDELMRLDDDDLESLQRLCRYGAKLSGNGADQTEYRAFREQLSLIDAEQANRAEPACPRYQPQ